MHFLQKIYKLSKTNIFFSHFEGTRGEKTKYFAPQQQLHIMHGFILAVFYRTMDPNFLQKTVREHFVLAQLYFVVKCQIVCFQKLVTKRCHLVQGPCIVTKMGITQKWQKTLMLTKMLVMKTQVWYETKLEILILTAILLPFIIIIYVICMYTHNQLKNT